jgi:hypothetical protein
VDPAALLAAQERGTRVHAATALDDLGTLDEGSIEPDELGYLEAWRKFRRALDFRPTLIEHRVYCARHRYAGTLDRIGTMRGKRGLIDIKSGVRTRAAGPQTAAYANCVPRSKTIPRYAVYLQSDGKFDLVPLRDHQDLYVFLAALKLYYWKEHHP